MNQGPTPGRCPGFVSSNLIALCWTGEGSGWLLPASSSNAQPLHRPRCSVLRELSKVIEVRPACQPQTHKMSKQLGRLEIPSRGTWAPIALSSLSSPGMLHVQWLGFGAVGSLSFRRPFYRGQTLGLRSGLPSSPAYNFQQAPARSLYLFNSLRVQQMREVCKLLERYDAPFRITPSLRFSATALY